MFLSPPLKEIHISMSQAWIHSEVPRNILPVIASTISTLPTSILELLLVDTTRFRRVSWAYFQDSFSSVALRCGPSLRKFDSPVPLSDAAVDHLVRLPHLNTWRVDGPPPTFSTLTFPLIFPPLTKFTLGEGAASGWFCLFERLERGVSVTQRVPPLAKVKESLKHLRVQDFHSPCPIVNVSFASTVQIFQNLVCLNVGAMCPSERNEGPCIFRLNNDNVTEIVVALSQLESLVLGRPCFENTCATTVACLLPISVHCIKLEKLEIHFNTTNIVDDIKGMSEDSQIEELRSLPRCTLMCLDVHHIPLTLDEPGFGTVMNGMVDIFPSLEFCGGHDRTWRELSVRIERFKPPEQVLRKSSL